MSDEAFVPPALVHLAEVAGITPAYWDAGGAYRTVPEATLHTLLGALGVLDPTGADATAIDAALERERLAPWRRSLPPVRVLYESEPAAIALVAAEERLGASCRWSILTEDGRALEGEFSPESLEPLRVDAVAADERVELDGRTLRRLTLPLPELPLGYHALEVHGALGDGDVATAHLVVAPRTCHGATATGEADGDARVWGLALQLYAVRSTRNWGIGDFSDLAHAAEAVGELGGDVVGVNPLHALFAHDPESASPYSPSSRLFLNPLCIDVEAVDGWEEARVALEGDDLTTRLDALRAGDVIDYTAVSDLKHAAFEALWKVFVARELGRDTVAGRAFAAFREGEGEPLAHFALFEALREALDARGEIAGDWRRWPEELRSPASPAVAAFAAERTARVDFHAWLQWLAAGQLDAAAARADTAGLAVGLYRDLAVGISAGGGDAWGDQALFASGIHVGAPPDDFSANGQDWGLPPLDPRGLAEAGYAPFATILRANMHAAGAIRIDHVMGLARLFWIPAGESPATGAYVAYPLEDMLAVVALESRRAGCIVVGEDLGTVPEGFREALAAAGVLSYRLMYFEKHYDGDQSFRDPGEYPPQSLVGADTHDLPTLRGFWGAVDLELRKSLDLFPEPDMHGAQDWARGEDRGRLLHALARAGVLPDGVDPDASGDVAMDDGLVRAVHRFLARTRSRLLLANVEDLLGQVEQMNLPGTDRDVYPNWRRKLPIGLENWLDHAPLVDTARAMSAERGTASNRARLVDGS